MMRVPFCPKPRIELLQCTCLLVAQSGHDELLSQCPLLGVKRTSKFAGVMSAFDPKRTFCSSLNEPRSKRYDALS